MSANARVIPIVAAGRAAPGSRLAALGDFLRRRQRAIVALQWAVVVVYALLVSVPAFLPLPPEHAGILDNLTRFAQFAFWGIWWPFVILATLAFGRVWCGYLCPEGALTEWASRHGAGRRLPRWLKWGGWPFVAFVTTTAYGQLVSVYEYPKPALLVLGGSTLAAVGIGFVYGRGARLWCRHLCPVSGVFTVLARLGVMHFRVDRVAWAHSHARPEPIRCAPLVHIKSMKGAADCQLCARCSGHKDAIRLAARWPGREVAELAVDSVPAWQARLVVWGLLGVAAGAFQWSASPWLVAAKQRIAAALVAHDWYAPLADPGRWWLVTHYPQVNDVFSWLDGGLVLGYLAAAALVLGTWVAAWLTAAERALGRPGARHALALTLTPFAGLTVFLGLFGVTGVQLAAEGIVLAWLPALRAILLAAGAVWSLVLARAWLARQDLRPARRRAGIAAVALALSLPLAAWLVMFYVW